MDKTTKIVIVGLVAFVLWQNQKALRGAAAGAVRGAYSTAPDPRVGQVQTSRAGGTIIRVPGLGVYQNLPDGTVTIGVDPSLFRGPPAADAPPLVAAAPTPFPAYDAAAWVQTTPVTPYDWIPTAVANQPAGYLQLQ